MTQFLEGPTPSLMTGVGELSTMVCAEKTSLSHIYTSQSSHYEERDRAHALCCAPQLPCGAKFARLVSVVKLIILFAY